MSDESTLAAATLLAPLLLPPIEGKIVGDTSGLGTTTGSAEQNSGAFADLLAQNIDSDVESLTPADFTATSQTKQPISEELREISVLHSDRISLPAKFGDASEFVDSNVALKAGGETLPGAGNALPDDVETGLTGQFSGKTIFTESEPVDTRARARIDSLQQFDAHENANRDNHLTDNTTPVTEATLSALQAQNEATGTSPNQAANRSSLPATGQGVETSTGRVVQNYLTEPATTNLSLDTATGESPDGDTEGFSNHQAQADRALSQELASNRSTLAEFALEESPFEEPTSSASASPLKGTDLLTPPTASGLSSLNGALPTSTALTMSADRSAASAQIAQQLASFVRNGTDQAEINLSPPHLGRISVQISVQNDQATVMLTAPNSEVRAAMEASLPKLDALLAEAGLTLADAGVEDQANPRSAEPPKPQGYPTSPSDEMVMELSTPAPRSIGLIDAYA